MLRHRAIFRQPRLPRISINKNTKVLQSRDGSISLFRFRDDIDMIIDPSLLQSGTCTWANVVAVVLKMSERRSKDLT